MAITVTATRIYPANKAKNISAAEGVSEVNGTAETFETVFPAKDETCYFLVKNGNVAPIQVKLLASCANNGFTESNYTVSKNTICAIGIESGFVKDVNGKVSIKATPGSATTLKLSGVTVSAIYSGVGTN